MPIIAEWICVLLVGLVAGGLAFVRFGDVLSNPELPAPLYVKTHRTLYRRADPFMPILLVLAAAVGSTPLFTVIVSGSWLIVALGVVAVLSIVIVIVLSNVMNKPIHDVISTWGNGALPVEWRSTVRRFNRYHGYRTAAALTLYAAIVSCWLTPTSTSTLGIPLAVALLLSTGLVAGGLVFMCVVVSTSARALDAPSYIATHQVLARKVTTYMAAVSSAAALAGAGSISALYRAGAATAVLFAMISLAAMLAVIAISISLSAPLDRQISAWNPAQPPAEWSQVRTAWIHRNILRTIISSVALVTASISAIGV